MSQAHEHHHEVAPSYWPLVISIALFFIALGVVNWLHASASAPYLLGIGALILAWVFYGWFRDVIHENRFVQNPALESSFRWSMFWFIFTEFMFFAVFFMALFYARLISVPAIGGIDTYGTLTHLLLWPDFQSGWPLLKFPDPNQYPNVKATMDPWGIPALNTLTLILSDVAITWAYWCVLAKKRAWTAVGLVLTILLSIAFLYLQIHEFGAAYTENGLKLTSGIYGSTFFMLTGVHGTHVLAGIIMLSTLLYRTLRGHFTPESSFAFGAISWYWHFIDVLWLALFIAVYWL